MKRFLSVLLSLTMLLILIPTSALPVFAVEEYTEGAYTYTVTDGEATIIKYNGAGGTVVTPTTLGGYPVVAIGSSAFSAHEYIYSVSISDGVTTIGDSAFSCCPNLEYVSFPDSVIRFDGGDHFVDCTNLKTVVLGKGLENISFCMFSGCSSLSTINIPESVTSIAGDAFYRTNLSEIILPASVCYIGYNAFYKCDSLSDVYYAGTEEDRAKITIEGANGPLWNATWHYSDGTASTPVRGLLYEINNGEVTITGHTDDVPEHLVIPATIEGYPVTAIGRHAFNGDYEGYHIVSIAIPEGVVSIGDNAFWFAKTLVSVDIPDTVTSIGEYAFGYSGVKEVDLPKGLTTIRWGTFLGARITSVTIPDSVTTIEDEAFIYSNLTSVVIPDSVTTIGALAFDECHQLTSVVLSRNLDTVSWYMFSWCENLTSVVIPDGVKTIDGGAFSGTGLTSLTLPDSVTTICEDAFLACANMKDVTLPKNIEMIESGAFKRCDALTDVYYAGTKEDRANIYAEGDNDPLLNATWHYNYVEPTELFSPIVTHSVMDTEQGTGLAYRFELAVKGMNVVRRNVADYTNATVNYRGADCKLLGMGAVVTNVAVIGENAEELTRNNANGRNVLDIATVYLCDLEETSCAFATRIVNIPDEYKERTIYARPYYIVEVDGEAITVYGDIDTASCVSAIG